MKEVYAFTLNLSMKFVNVNFFYIIFILGDNRWHTTIMAMKTSKSD